jgi:hypothetical protein
MTQQEAETAAFGYPRERYSRDIRGKALLGQSHALLRLRTVQLLDCDITTEEHRAGTSDRSASAYIKSDDEWTPFRTARQFGCGH